MKVNVLIVVTFVLGMAALGRVGADTITISPSDDGSLYTNSGAVDDGAYVLVAGYIQGIVKFPTSAITGPITAATLTVNPYGLPLSAPAVDVYGIMEDNGAIGAQDINAGTFLGTMELPSNLGYGQDASFDVTAFMAGVTSSYVGFNLRDAGGPTCSVPWNTTTGTPLSLSSPRLPSRRLARWCWQGWASASRRAGGNDAGAARNTRGCGPTRRWGAELVGCVGVGPGLRVAGICCVLQEARSTPQNIRQLDVVALTADLAEQGLVRGQVGTVVEVLAPGVYEVEFSDDAGRTYAQLALPESQLLVLHYQPQQAA
jgi:hypothetical protein